MNLIKLHLKVIIFLIFSAQANADVQLADNDKIISLMKQGVPLIDIRTYSEWQNTGIIKNSKLLTFFDNDGKSDVESWINKWTNTFFAAVYLPILFKEFP